MERSSRIRFAKKVVTLHGWIVRRRRARSDGLRFKVFSRGLTLGFVPKGDRDESSKANAIPKGHLVIHVGRLESEKCRVIVPVAHINHFLFRELLDRVESVYGYDHQGAINLPCSFSEYEAVRRSIAAAENPSRAILGPGKKRIFAMPMPYIRNSFSKILVDSIF